VPQDFGAALDRDPPARRTFDALTYSNQRRHVLAIEGAKTPETGDVGSCIATAGTSYGGEREPRSARVAERAAGRAMSRPRAAAGGGTVVEVAPDRLAPWVNRFVVRNAGLAALSATPSVVTVRGGDGTTAELAVPYAPMGLTDLEPVEALLDHVTRVGALGLVLVRAGAYSIGACRDRVVLSSTTDRRYVQGRTAAGGSSQQRFARRRSNQRRESYAAAADAVARVLVPIAGTLSGVVLAGDRPALAAVMADPRLRAFATLPSRTIPDIAEPRRAVLDEVAGRSLDVIITVRPPAWSALDGASTMA